MMRHIRADSVGVQRLILGGTVWAFKMVRLLFSWCRVEAQWWIQWLASTGHSGKDCSGDVLFVCLRSKVSVIGLIMFGWREGQLDWAVLSAQQLQIAAFFSLRTCHISGRRGQCVLVTGVTCVWRASGGIGQNDDSTEWIRIGQNGRSLRLATYFLWIWALVALLW